jgi:hypothetical protein
MRAESTIMSLQGFSRIFWSEVGNTWPVQWTFMGQGAGQGMYRRDRGTQRATMVARGAKAMNELLKVAIDGQAPPPDAGSRANGSAPHHGTSSKAPAGMPVSTHIKLNLTR